MKASATRCNMFTTASLIGSGDNLHHAFGACIICCEMLAAGKYSAQPVECRIY